MDFDDLTKEEKKALGIGCSVVFVIILALILFFMSFTTIKSGEVGLRVRFGKIVDTSMKEGINFKIPFIEKIEKMNVRVQKAELTTTSSSKDLQDVTMGIAVNFRVDRDAAPELYRNVGTSYTETVLQPAIQESIKSVTARYTAEELITKRSQVSDECLDELSTRIEKYGLVIDEFNIIDFTFSAEFDRAIEEKQVAEQKVLTAKQELEKEKVEAEKKVVAAEADKKANELKEKSLTDKILQDKFIEKWNGQLPTVTGGSSMINISDLLK